MNIVIAYDGSNHAKAAVDDLRRSGMPRGVNALVVSVGETFLPTPSASSALIDVGSMSRRVASTLVQARALVCGRPIASSSGRVGSTASESAQEA